MGETKITLDIIEQDKIWITRDGRTLRVENMDPNHRKNTLRMLERHASGLHFRAFMRYFVLPIGGRPNGEISNSVLDRAEQAFLEKKPIDWLGEQLLVRRLRVLVDEDNVRERRLALKSARSDVLTTAGPVARPRGLRREH